MSRHHNKPPLLLPHASCKVPAWSQEQAALQCLLPYSGMPVLSGSLNCARAGLQSPCHCTCIELVNFCSGTGHCVKPDAVVIGQGICIESCMSYAILMVLLLAPTHQQEFLAKAPSSLVRRQLPQGVVAACIINVMSMSYSLLRLSKFDQVPCQCTACWWQLW